MFNFKVTVLPSGSTVSYLDTEDGTDYYVIHCWHGVHECQFEV